MTNTTRHCFVAFSALLLCACAHPSTLSPGLSNQEIEAERAQQQQMLEQIKGAPAAVSTFEDLQTNGAYYKQRMDAVAPRIIQAGEKICSDTGKDPQTCHFSFVVENGKDLNAYADGQKIHITTTMVHFAQSDEDLAFILSHEYAHNLLQHVNAAQQNAMTGGLIGMAADQLAASQGYDTGGAFSQLGQEQGVQRYSVGFEREADYVGMYIAYHAGFQIEHAADIWRRMTAANPDGLYTRNSHPTNPERYLSMQKTMQEIRAKEAAGQPVLPNFKSR